MPHQLGKILLVCHSWRLLHSPLLCCTPSSANATAEIAGVAADKQRSTKSRARYKVTRLLLCRRKAQAGPENFEPAGQTGAPASERLSELAEAVTPRPTSWCVVKLGRCAS